MTYSSFGRRLGAYLIDFLLLSPLFALQIWASGHSISMAILSAVLVSVAFTASMAKAAPSLAWYTQRRPGNQ